jgi:hypothetical protein
MVSLLSTAAAIPQWPGQPGGLEAVNEFGQGLRWAVALHFNKWLAAANAADVAAARDTAMNPAVLTALALAIIAGGDPARKCAPPTAILNFFIFDFEFWFLPKLPTADRRASFALALSMLRFNRGDHYRSIALA